MPSPTSPLSERSDVDFTRREAQKYRILLGRHKTLTRQVFASQALSEPCDAPEPSEDDSETPSGDNVQALALDYLNKENLGFLDLYIFTDHIHKPVYDLLGIRNQNGLCLTNEEIEKYPTKQMAEWLHAARPAYESFGDDDESAARYTDRLEGLKKDLARSASEARQGEWRWRIAEEAKLRSALRWYPFFVTLTIDPARIDNDEKFWKAKHVRDFIRKVTDKVTDALGHERIRHSGIKQEEYVVWVGVLEHGASGVHHHMHILLWCREVPGAWKQDPNAGRSPEWRTLDRCRQMETLWPWSSNQVRCQYFRSTGDVWSSLGFCIPVSWDERAKRVVSKKVGPPEVAGAYITKYMTKKFATEYDAPPWASRIRGTRGIGMQRFKEMIHAMSDEDIEQLAERPKKLADAIEAQMKTGVPIALLRKHIKEEKFYRSVNEGRLDPREHMAQSRTFLSSLTEKAIEGNRMSALSKGGRYSIMTETLEADRPLDDNREPINPFDKEKYMAAVDRVAEVFPKPVQGVAIEPIPGMFR